MRRHVGLSYAALVVLFAVSCFQYAVQPIPLSEAARRPGVSRSFTGGLSAGTGMLYSHYTVVWWDYIGMHSWDETRCDRFTAGKGVVSIEAGTDRLKGVGHLGLGLARMTDTFWHPNPRGLHNPAGVSRWAFPVEWSAGLKIGTGTGSALRLTLGSDYCLFVPDKNVNDPLLPLPSADAFFLQDFGSRWTAGVGIGSRGLQLNASHHLPFNKSLSGNIAANLLYYGRPARWTRSEPRIERPIALQAGISLGAN